MIQDIYEDILQGVRIILIGYPAKISHSEYPTGYPTGYPVRISSEHILVTYLGNLSICSG
jgi:hypothetical protein